MTHGTRLWLDGDNLVEQRIYDSAPILEHAKALRSTGQVGSSELRHAASFPPAAVELYKARWGISHHEFMSNPVHIRRMLADPDLAECRVWEGRTKRGSE